MTYKELTPEQLKRKRNVSPKRLKFIKERIEKTCRDYAPIFKEYSEGDDTKIDELALKGKILEKYICKLNELTDIGPRMYRHEVGSHCLTALTIFPKEISEGDKSFKEFYIKHAAEKLEKALALTPVIDMSIKNSKEFSFKDTIQKEVAYYKEFLEEGNMKITINAPEEIKVNSYEEIIRAATGTIIGDAINHSPRGTKEKQTEIHVKLSSNKNYVSFKVVNEYHPDAPRNFPEGIGLGEGTGGQFLNHIADYAKGTIIERSSTTIDSTRGKYTTSIQIPNKYVQDRQMRLKYAKPEAIDRLNRRKGKSVDALVVE